MQYSALIKTHSTLPYNRRSARTQFGAFITHSPYNRRSARTQFGAFITHSPYIRRRPDLQVRATNALSHLRATVDHMKPWLKQFDDMSKSSVASEVIANKNFSFLIIYFFVRLVSYMAEKGFLNIWNTMLMPINVGDFVTFTTNNTPICGVVKDIGLITTTIDVGYYELLLPNDKFLGEIIKKSTLSEASLILQISVPVQTIRPYKNFKRTLLKKIEAQDCVVMGSTNIKLSFVDYGRGLYDVSVACTLNAKNCKHYNQLKESITMLIDDYVTRLQAR